MNRSKTVLAIRSPRFSEKLEPLNIPVKFKNEKDLQENLKDFNNGVNSPLSPQFLPRITAIHKTLPKIIRQQPSLAERRKSNDPARLKEMISALNFDVPVKLTEGENKDSKLPNQLDFTFGLS